MGMRPFRLSGGFDELCKIFDMTKRAEHGTLMHPQGTVSCLSTHYATSHLLTASYDNTIAVVRMGLLAGGWEQKKLLRN